MKLRNATILLILDPLQDNSRKLTFPGTTSRFLKNGENRTFNWTITVAQHENTDSHALDGEIRKTFISDNLFYENKHCPDT